MAFEGLFLGVHQEGSVIRVWLHPFRLGLSTYEYGLIIKLRGKYRAIGRRTV